MARSRALEYRGMGSFPRARALGDGPPGARARRLSPVDVTTSPATRAPFRVPRPLQLVAAYRGDAHLGRGDVLLGLELHDRPWRRVAYRSSDAAAVSCAWCGAELAATPGQRFCSKRCRQTAYRVRKRAGVVGAGVDDTLALLPAASPGAGTFAYADPPYPGLARKYYRHESSYAGEVDHAALIASLRSQRLTGWALSTSPGALALVLPLCPAGARVCAWVKPNGVSSRTWGIHNAWEVVIVAGGRPRRPGVRDWLSAKPARGHGSLMGRKPLAFCAWLFDLLGMQPGDELLDLFPGTGVVTRAWRELSSYPRPRATALKLAQ